MPEPPQLLEDASLALDAGDSDAAYKLARQAIRLAPEDPQAVFLMARILGQRHRFPEAIEMLDQLAVTTPAMRLPIMGQTADWLARFGQWSEAEQRYRALLDLVPDAALVHRNLARLLIRQGRSVEAATHRKLLCRWGDVEEGELRQLLLVAHPFSGDAATEAFDPIGPGGMVAVDISQGDWPSARGRLEAQEPIAPAASALLGRVYVHLNDFAALQDWIVAASQSSEAYDLYADTWIAKGALAAHQGDHADAIRCFAEAVLRDQTDRQAYALMSQSLAQLGASNESAAVANRAQLIEQTQSLGAEMAETADRDDQQLATLIELLDQLHRPFEALGWRGVRLAYHRSASSLSDADQRRLLSAIDSDRTARLNDDDEQGRRRFLLCGVDLDALAVADGEHPASGAEQ